jgi:hypothetical protein
MHIKFTYVDSVTQISVETEPARNGPSFPRIKGLNWLFAAERKYPTDVPEFFGLCDDDADLTIDGCFGEITEEEFIAERQEEINSRQPYPSWVVNQTVSSDPSMFLVDLWSPPVAMPEDMGTGDPPKFYEWDEDSVNWKEVVETL